MAYGDKIIFDGNEYLTVLNLTCNIKVGMMVGLCEHEVGMSDRTMRAVPAATLEFACGTKRYPVVFVGEPNSSAVGVMIRGKCTLVTKDGHRYELEVK